MELLFLIILLFIPIFLLFLFNPITKKLDHGRRTKLPPGPTNLPIIGNLHCLLRRQPAHHTLRDLSVVHGPVMHLRLGEIHTVIISSSAAAKEIMKTHDHTFASRPLSTSIKTLSYGGKGLIFTPNNDYWRQMRRICTLELLSPKRVLSFKAIREEEVSLLIRSIVDSSNVSLNLSTMFVNISNSITARAVIGGKTEDQHVYLSALENLIKLALTFSVDDLFPSMSKFTTFLMSSKLKRSCLKLDTILEKILEDHIKKKTTTAAGETEDDLTDFLLRIRHDVNILPIPLSNDHIKSVINDVLMAGSETSATLMEWVMSELIRNPTVMEKVQSEVRKVLEDKIKSEVLVEEELIRGKLSYLSLVIKETLRLRPPAPLLLPRENQENCKVMDYDIPAKTTVMVNVWAIGRDPKYWDDPEVFRPERFEDNCMDFKGNNFEFIPFGAGRRICPGIQFGLANVEITLAYLLYYFDWKYISKKGEELDMTEAFGAAMKRKSPLFLLATPHFPLLLS